MKTVYPELSKMTIERREEYLKDYEQCFANDSSFPFKIEKPFKNFNEDGLKYSHEFLSKIRCFNVFFPIEIMESFVDIITKDLVDNHPEKLRDYLVSEKNVNINEINATAVGNLAYIILHIKDEKLRNRCKLLLNTIYKDCEKMILDFQKSINQA